MRTGGTRAGTAGENLLRPSTVPLAELLASITVHRERGARWGCSCHGRGSKHHRSRGYQVVPHRASAVVPIEWSATGFSGVGQASTGCSSQWPRWVVPLCLGSVSSDLLSSVYTPMLHGFDATWVQTALRKRPRKRATNAARISSRRLSTATQEVRWKQQRESVGSSQGTEAVDWLSDSWAEGGVTGRSLERDWHCVAPRGCADQG